MHLSLVIFREPCSICPYLQKCSWGGTCDRAFSVAAPTLFKSVECLALEDLSRPCLNHCVQHMYFIGHVICYDFLSLNWISMYLLLGYMLPNNPNHTASSCCNWNGGNSAVGDCCSAISFLPFQLFQKGCRMKAHPVLPLPFK